MSIIYICKTENPNQTLVVFSEQPTNKELFMAAGIEGSVEMTINVEHLALIKAVAVPMLGGYAGFYDNIHLIVKKSTKESFQFFSEFKSNPQTWPIAEQAIHIFENKAQQAMGNSTVSSIEQALNYLEFAAMLGSQRANYNTATVAHTAILNYPDAPEVNRWMELAKTHYAEYANQLMVDETWIAMDMFWYLVEDQENIEYVEKQILNTENETLIMQLIHDIYYEGEVPLSFSIKEWIESHSMENDGSDFKEWYEQQTSVTNRQLMDWISQYKQPLALFIACFLFVLYMGASGILILFFIGAIIGWGLMIKNKKDKANKQNEKSR